MRRTSLAVALASLVVLAGCGTSAPDTDESTLTPAPVPEAGRPTATAGSGELAPGLRETGVVDPGRLVAAHAATLATTSFTVRQSVVRRYPNRTVASRYETVVRLSADKRRFHYVLRQANRRDGRLHETRIERFSTGEHVFERVRQDGATRYDRVRAPGVRAFLPANASNRRALERLLDRVDTTVTGRLVRNGATLYRVGIENGRTDAPPLENVSLTALVAESGLVSEYRVEYDVTHGGVRHHVVVEVAYTRLGETTVERPAWVDDASNATRTRTAHP